MNLYDLKDVVDSFPESPMGNSMGESFNSDIPYRTMFRAALKSQPLQNHN
ncbi:MAG: hypothetical protein LBT10_00605 [Methanobrevibacter sp.]|nr:hypothetical protein [Methanobrevibacter sp.]